MFIGVHDFMIDSRLKIDFALLICLTGAFATNCYPKYDKRKLSRSIGNIRQSSMKQFVMRQSSMIGKITVCHSGRKRYNDNQVSFR